MADWTFALDGGAFEPVTLPHDWSVAFPFDSINGEGAVGYLPGGKGEYRKEFATPAEPVVYLYFDGVYNNATVMLNGKEVGFHPFGYAPFYYDVSDFLTGNGSNDLRVLVDRSRYADSRWYPGAGIYREVKLLREGAVHVPPWGTSVTTPKVSKDLAVVNVSTTVLNKGAGTRDAVLMTELVAPDGTTVATAMREITLPATSERSFTAELRVTKPKLWDVDDPNLYQVRVRLKTEGQTTKEHPTTIGLRSFAFDPDTGFTLNGRNRKIKGVCLHHDGGLVGAAVPRAVWRRRLQTLKDGGCNAIRSAHNPASEEFLTLCDEMGFLVQDEFYDEWDYPKDKRKNMGESTSTDYITRGHHEHFQEWKKTDLQNTVRAHRNHPSIFQWSIGNEIEWTYPSQREVTGFFGADSNGNYFWNEPPYSPERIRRLQDSVETREHKIGETAQLLADWTREIDPTRPVTANCILPSASYESGYADALDVIGFSYRRVMYDYGHRRRPDLPVMGTENLAQYHEWKAVEERPFVSGTFLWTGIDYLGESNGGWPSKSTTSGLLNLAGFPRPSYYMYQSLWTEKPMIHVTTQTTDKAIFRVDAAGKAVEKRPDGWQRALWSWHDVNRHWNYAVGDTVIVEVLSNCPTAELFLGGRSLGKQMLAGQADHTYKWAVPYAPGEITVKGYEGETTVTQSLRTVNAPAGIRLTTEGSGEGGVVHVVARLYDDLGRRVRHAEAELAFVIEGGELLGVDNGAGRNVAAFQGGRVATDQGRALAILRTNGRETTLTVTAPGLARAAVTLPAKQ